MNKVTVSKTSMQNNRMNLWKRAVNSQHRLLRQRATDYFRTLKRHSELKSCVKKNDLDSFKVIRATSGGPSECGIKALQVKRCWYYRKRGCVKA